VSTTDDLLVILHSVFSIMIGIEVLCMYVCHGVCRYVCLLMCDDFAKHILYFDLYIHVLSMYIHGCVRVRVCIVCVCVCVCVRV